MKLALLLQILLVGSLLALAMPASHFNVPAVILNPLTPPLTFQPAVSSAPNATIAVQPTATIDVARTMKQIMVELALNNTPMVPQFNGVQVVLSYDPHVLTGASLDYSSNVFAQTSYPPAVVADCLDGHAANNGPSNLCGSNDGPGITSFAESILGGTVPAGTQGNIFFLTFNVNTTTPHFSQIQIVRAIIGNGQIDPSTGKPNIIPVTTLDGYYTSLITVGDFRITASPTSLIVRKASINDPFALAISTITLTSINGFSGSVTLAATPTSFLGENFNPSQVNLAANSSASASLVVAGGNSPPGTYFVTVTGTSGSISHFVTLTVQVVIQPDFQLLLSIPPGGNIVFAGGTTSVGVQLFSTSVSSFNGTVTLTGQVSPLVSNGPTLSFNPTQISFAPTGTPFSRLTISTTASTPSGNYTITVKGTSGTLVRIVQLQVTVLPPPVLTLSPSSGPVGTEVRVRGSGFLSPSQGPFFFPVELQITFDDQLIGFFFLRGSSFNFTFNVPDAQAGIVHQIHAKELFPSSLDVQASFLVLPEPSALTVSVTAGTIYFPGDTASIFATTNLNGRPATATNLQLILFRPNGSNITLTAVLVTPGVYKASYLIPTTGSIGTYAVMVKAHQAGSSDGSALASFEVKPTWLQSNGRNLITATSIVGAVGALGVVALAWRKGYFTRRKDEFAIL